MTRLASVCAALRYRGMSGRALGAWATPRLSALPYLVPRLPAAEGTAGALLELFVAGREIDLPRLAQVDLDALHQSRWSELNKCRVKALIREGRMRSMGLAKIPDQVLRDKAGSETLRQTKTSAIPPSIKQVLMANSQAWRNFKGLAPSYRRLYVKWITAARKEETRQRRMQEALALLSQGKKLGLK